MIGHRSTTDWPYKAIKQFCGIAQRYHTCFSLSSPVFDSQRSQKKFRRKIIDVAEVNQRHWLEESGQWLVASQYYKKAKKKKNSDLLSWLIILIKNLTYTGKDKNQFIDDWGQNNVSDSVRSILINFGLDARHFFYTERYFWALFRPRLARTENQDRRKLEPGRLKTDIRLKKAEEERERKERKVNRRMKRVATWWTWCRQKRLTCISPFWQFLTQVLFLRLKLVWDLFEDS